MPTKCCVEGQPRRIATSKPLAICVPAIGFIRSSEVSALPGCVHHAYNWAQYFGNTSQLAADGVAFAFFGVAFVILLVVHFRRNRRWNPPRKFEQTA